MATIRIEPIGDCWELLGERDQQYGSIEEEEDGRFVVDWGTPPGWQLRFASFDEAAAFVQQNAGDIADGQQL